MSDIRMSTSVPAERVVHLLISSFPQNTKRVSLEFSRVPSQCSKQDQNNNLLGTYTNVKLATKVMRLKTWLCWLVTG